MSTNDAQLSTFPFDASFIKIDHFLWMKTFYNVCRFPFDSVANLAFHLELNFAIGPTHIKNLMRSMLIQASFGVGGGGGVGGVGGISGIGVGIIVIIGVQIGSIGDALSTIFVLIWASLLFNDFSLPG